METLALEQVLAALLAELRASGSDVDTNGQYRPVVAAAYQALALAQAERARTADAPAITEEFVIVERSHGHAERIQRILPTQNPATYALFDAALDALAIWAEHGLSLESTGLYRLTPVSRFEIQRQAADLGWCRQCWAIRPLADVTCEECTGELVPLNQHLLHDPVKLRRNVRLRVVDQTLPAPAGAVASPPPKQWTVLSFETVEDALALAQARRDRGNYSWVEWAAADGTP